MNPSLNGPKRALLRVPFRTAFLSLAMEFAEKSAQGLGYADRESNGLMLAVEELFCFYQRQAAADSAMEIELEDQGYRLGLSLSFRAADPDMRPFNLTWRIRPDSEDSLNTLGPMIAARSVSSLRLEFAAQEQVTIRVTRDRDYPLANAVELPPRKIIETPRMAESSREDVTHFAAMVAASRGAAVPTFLARPAMAGDMLSAGHLHALLALSGEWIVGGVLWLPLSDGNVELFGPYVLCDDPQDVVLTMLMEGAISSVSRTRFRGMLRRQGPLARYERFFDYLGEIPFKAGAERAESRVYYFRQLKEESGAAVYCRGGLASFLRGQFERLCLPRQLRDTAAVQQRLSGNSVLTVDLDWPGSTAIIRPLRPGEDMTANLEGHLKLLQDQGIEQVLMEINAARIEETAFAHAMEETGFLPRLLIPDAVAGDVVVYEWSPGKQQP